jgi:hypothetical protein
LQLGPSNDSSKNSMAESSIMLLDSPKECRVEKKEEKMEDSSAFKE